VVVTGGEARLLLLKAEAALITLIVRR